MGVTIYTPHLKYYASWVKPVEATKMGPRFRVQPWEMTVAIVAICPSSHSANPSIPSSFCSFVSNPVSLI